MAPKRQPNATPARNPASAVRCVPEIPVYQKNRRIGDASRFFRRDLMRTRPELELVGCIVGVIKKEQSQKSIGSCVKTGLFRNVTQLVVSIGGSGLAQ